MRKLAIGLALAMAASAFAAAACQAGVSEIRFGVLAHDPLTQKEEGVDLNAELFFDSWTDGSWQLRPTIGGTVNLNGDTSQAYLGLIYGGPISENWFVEIGGGASVHNGKLETTDPERKELGSRVLFHVQASIGVMLSDTTSLSLYADHISNAGIEERNEGLETAGLRIGFKL
jgi:hypothetical protein